MEKEEENSWVFDSLVCFLNGPIWNAPLDNFIEEKSLIFEPNDKENKDYKVIFDEFKNLVDFMLGNFMEDIGITPDQFEEACREGQKYHVTFDNSLFEQIWAANDYETFKRMMTQKNVELQLQALELIERKYGITPQSFIPQKKDNFGGVTKEIPVIIEKTALETKVMEEVTRNFTQQPADDAEEEQHVFEDKSILKQSLEEVKEKAAHNQQTTSLLFPSKEDDKEDVPPATNQKDKAEDSVSLKKPQEVDALELKRRQEYLRAQRDKLVALKKDARKRQFGDASDEKNNLEVGGGKSKNRPKSAKAAEAVLKGEKIEPQQLQIRKSLAERLKAEVVDKK